MCDCSIIADIDDRTHAASFDLKGAFLVALEGLVGRYSVQYTQYTSIYTPPDLLILFRVGFGRVMARIPSPVRCPFSELGDRFGEY